MLEQNIEQKTPKKIIVDLVTLYVVDNLNGTDMFLQLNTKIERF